MSATWPQERRLAFRNDAIGRLAALNKAAAEGRSSPPNVVETTDPSQIPLLVPDWAPGPIVLIGTTGDFSDLGSLFDLPLDWRSSVHVIAALDLFWWAHQMRPGHLQLTRLATGVTNSDHGDAYRNGSR